MERVWKTSSSRGLADLKFNLKKKPASYHTWQSFKPLNEGEEGNWIQAIWCCILHNFLRRKQPVFLHAFQMAKDADNSIMACSLPDRFRKRRSVPHCYAVRFLSFQSPTILRFIQMSSILPRNEEGERGVLCLKSDWALVESLSADWRDVSCSKGMNT